VYVVGSQKDISHQCSDTPISFQNASNYGRKASTAPVYFAVWISMYQSCAQNDLRVSLSTVRKRIVYYRDSNDY